jgi:hypothetical protein
MYLRDYPVLREFRSALLYCVSLYRLAGRSARAAAGLALLLPVLSLSLHPEISALKQLIGSKTHSQEQGKDYPSQGLQVTVVLSRLLLSKQAKQAIM